MRSAKLVDIGKFQLEEVPVPEIQKPTDVLVAVKAVGVCGTDLHIFKSGRADVKFPRVMGHELTGLVQKVGCAVTKIKVGDRVALDPVFACGECSACRKGYPNVCEHVCCYGVQMDGGYQDYIVVDQKHLFVFSPSISYETAALAEPFSIASNILDRASLKEGETILIIGSGTIGLAVLQTAKMMGAHAIISDIIDEKLKLAKKMGADHTINSNTESLQKVGRSVAPDGFDVIVDAVGTTPLFRQAVDLAGPRSRIICIGFDARTLDIPLDIITKKELSIIGSRMNCFRFPVVMEWINEGKICADEMITRRYSVEQIQKAFEESIKDGGKSIKTLILFD